MVKNGVLVGTAAALVLGAAFVAAALVSRPPEPAPPSASDDARVKITLVAPKEPPTPRTGSKLETVPPGAPDVPAVAVVRPPPPAPPPVARPEPDEREPELAQDDFLDERERDYADRYPAEPYSDRRERWRERRYDENPRGYDEYEPGPDAYEPMPYAPEPPPFWWRR